MKIDVRQMRRDAKKNFKERLEFVEKYAEWVKRTPNKDWSKQQNSLINR